jgi:hypothetical protein
MGDVINFNKARKAKAKTDKAETAVERRVLFGQTKADKALLKRKKDKDAKDLDQHKRDEPKE